MKTITEWAANAKLTQRWLCGVDGCCVRPARLNQSHNSRAKCVRVAELRDSTLSYIRRKQWMLALSREPPRGFSLGRLKWKCGTCLVSECTECWKHQREKKSHSWLSRCIFMCHHGAKPDCLSLFTTLNRCLPSGPPCTPCVIKCGYTRKASTPASCCDTWCCWARRSLLVDCWAVCFILEPQCRLPSAHMLKVTSASIWVLKSVMAAHGIDPGVIWVKPISDLSHSLLKALSHWGTGVCWSFSLHHPPVLSPISNSVWLQMNKCIIVQQAVCQCILLSE